MPARPREADDPWEPTVRQMRDYAEPLGVIDQKTNRFTRKKPDKPDVL